MKRPALVDLATHQHPWVSTPELATYLDCDPRTLLRMIDQLDGYKVGRGWRIPIESARRAFPVKRQRLA